MKSEKTGVEMLDERLKIIADDFRLAKHYLEKKGEREIYHAVDAFEDALGELACLDGDVLRGRLGRTINLDSYREKVSALYDESKKIREDLISSRTSPTNSLEATANEK